MSNSQYAHVVIGGGISGLGAAHFAHRAGVDTLVLEREERVGGCMQTHRFRDLDGFWVEAGSHSCFNSYGHLLGILEDLGLLGAVTAKTKQSYLLWRNGERRKVLSALHPVELAVSLPRLFALDKRACSVAEYYGRAFGRRNYRDLFAPAFRSVICQNADDFPAEALFRKKPRRADVLRSFTMPAGLSDIPEAIATQAGLTVRRGQGVAAILPDGDRFHVQLDDGASLGCDFLTLAVPPDICARLLGGVQPAAAGLIRRIGIAEIDSLLLAFDKAHLKLPELAGLISIDGAFFSAVSRDFIADPRWRGFAFHFPGGTLGQDQRIAAACEALGVRPADVAAVAHATNRLPRLRKGHQDLMQQLDARLAGGRLAITGNWFLGVSVEDCLTRGHAEHQRLFNT